MLYKIGEFSNDVLVVYTTRGRTRKYDECRRERHRAKGLENMAFQEVPRRGEPHDFFRYHHSIAAHPFGEKNEEMG